MPDLLSMLNADMAASLEADGSQPRQPPHKIAVPQILAGGCKPPKPTGATAIRFTDDMPAETVATFLRREDPNARKIAIHWLGTHRAASALQDLASLLTDPDLEIVEAVLLAIGAIGDSRASKLVGRMLVAEDESIRRAALLALSEVADDSVTDMLVRVLLDHDDGRYRAGAAFIIGKRGLARGRAALESAFDDPVPEVRAMAHQAFDLLPA